MAQLEIRTAEGITLRVDVAGPGTRFAAGVLDMAILASSTIAAALVLQLLVGLDPSGSAAFVQGLFALGLALVFVLYHVLCHLLQDGTTPGKRAMGIRLVGVDGNPAATLPVVLRGLFWILDVFLFVPLPLGVLLIAGSERRQRLGDLVAGTLVVRDPGRALAQEPWAKETWDGLEPKVLPLSPAVAARFGAADLDFLRRLIQRRGVESRRRQKLYTKVAAHYARRLELDGAVRDPRALIKELYLFLRDQRR